MSELKIGSTVWLFNVNRRVYHKNAALGRNPIYREHFEPITIIGETSKSWLAGHKWSPYKINKKTLAIPRHIGRGPCVYPSQQAVDDACWINDYRYDISRSVQACHNADTLRQIASLLNFDPTPTERRG